MVNKELLYGLVIFGFFIISLILSFNSGFSQGVVSVKNCVDNHGVFSFNHNVVVCDVSNSSLSDYNFNFTFNKGGFQ